MKKSLTFIRFCRTGERLLGDRRAPTDQLWLYYDGVSQHDAVFESTIDALLFGKRERVETFQPPRADRNAKAPAYTLADGEEKHKANPDTFEIPSHTERSAIMSGDHVKLLFQHEGKGERCWVNVMAPGFGLLANQPVLIPIDLGDPVRFERRHIIDIMRKDDAEFLCPDPETKQ